MLSAIVFVRQRLKAKAQEINHYVEKVKDLEKDLMIIATDLTNSVPFVFSKETTPDYQVLSCAYQ